MKFFSLAALGAASVVSLVGLSAHAASPLGDKVAVWECATLQGPIDFASAVARLPGGPFGPISQKKETKTSPSGGYDTETWETKSDSLDVTYSVAYPTGGDPKSTFSSHLTVMNVGTDPMFYSKDDRRSWLAKFGPTQDDVLGPYVGVGPKPEIGPYPLQVQVWDLADVVNANWTTDASLSYSKDFACAHPG